MGTLPFRDLNLALPREVVEIAELLAHQGYTVALTGGALRDMLLGRSAPVDWDLATNASWEQLTRLFPRALTVGSAFGSMKIPTDRSDISVDITIFREEGDYKDQRHPEWIRPGTMETDSQRRDFTINSLYFIPKTNELIDFHGGIQDLQNRRLRCVGAPGNRFREDPLRILRALRFQAQLGFSLARQTKAACGELAVELRQISKPRVRMELEKGWSTPRWPQFWKQLEETNALFWLTSKTPKLIQASPPHEIQPGYRNWSRILRWSRNHRILHDPMALFAWLLLRGEWEALRDEIFVLTRKESRLLDKTNSLFKILTSMDLTQKGERQSFGIKELWELHSESPQWLRQCLGLTRLTQSRAHHSAVPRVSPQWIHQFESLRRLHRKCSGEAFQGKQSWFTWSDVPENVRDRIPTPQRSLFIEEKRREQFYESTGLDFKRRSKRCAST